MKTTKLFSTFSLALIIAFATSTFANTTGKITIENTACRGIQHHVNLTIANEQALCNTYLIEIRDGKGQLVAPAKAYVSGVTGYDFFERGPASGIRVATLVRANFGHHFICEMELFTTPAAVQGPFLNGQVYRFDLFPNIQPNKE
jgi:hypothetical protein